MPEEALPAEEAHSEPEAEPEEEVQAGAAAGPPDSQDSFELVGAAEPEFPEALAGLAVGLSDQPGVSALARVQRCFRAGASARLDPRSPESQVCVPSGLKKEYWVFLEAGAFYIASSSSGVPRGAICWVFTSQREVSAFLLGAGQPSPWNL